MEDPALPLWNAGQVALVNAILNQLIPARADGRVPAAGDLGVAGFVARRVAADPALHALFDRGLDDAAGIGAGDVAAVKRIEAELPDFFAALQRLAYMGYYSRSDVRAALGLSPKPVHPDGYDVPREPEDLMAELTAPVRARGTCFRAV